MLKTNSDNKKTKTSGMSKKLKILLEKQNLEYSNLLKFHNKQNSAIQQAKRKELELLLAQEANVVNKREELAASYKTPKKKEVAKKDNLEDLSYF